ncbi:hypothetical protein N8I77_003229 [Diaporthe amygdali]|uniref:Uncharacterized protein n=1 Tax=Phomopsis amygdali TaxID=1214568 RepID=A0AAD9W4S2_PHOAM|nr:hypothetical protein N8I77_003229 [Diaporthe amygdali]
MASPDPSSHKPTSNTTTADEIIQGLGGKGSLVLPVIFTCLFVSLAFIGPSHRKSPRACFSLAYLFVFCILRSVGETIHFFDHTNAAPFVLINTAVTLLPVAVAFLVCDAWKLGEPRGEEARGNWFRKNWFDRFGGLAFAHAGGLISIVLIATSCSDLVGDGDYTYKDYGEQSVWALALGSDSLSLSMAAVFVCFALIYSLKLRYQIVRRPDQRLKQSYVVFVASAVMSFCVVIRAGTTTAFFATHRKDLNPVTGALVIRILFVYIPEVVAIMAVLVSGYLTGRYPGANDAGAGGAENGNGIELGPQSQPQPQPRDEGRVEGSGNSDQSQAAEGSERGRPGSPSGHIPGIGGTWMRLRREIFKTR